MSRMKMSVLHTCCVVFVMTLCCFPSPALSQNSSNYKGLAYCKMCHAAKDKGWQQTRHAKALQSLEKTNQHDLPDCVKCHVTGYGQPGGFIDFDLTPEMKNVQCEACHGPGSRHIGGKQGIIAKPGEGTCRQCHTSGQDPKFDYKRKATEVHGPR